MTTITILSNELIDIILQQKDISIKDVVNFGSTCTRFLAVIDDNNVLWQRKLYQRWPYFKRIYDKRIQNKENINFKDDIKTSIRCRNDLRRYLTLISDVFFYKNQLADTDLILVNPNLLLYMDAHTMNYYFLVDELLYLIEMSQLLPNCNLTHKYYSKKLLPLIHQHHLKRKWKRFINCPKEQQLLERAAIIVAQWYQPRKRIFYSDVEASLDNITQQVLEGLKNAHCDHPIFLTSAKQFSFWKYNNIDDNQWSRKDEKQIIDVLRTVLFDELGFCGLPDSNMLNPEAKHTLIDCVLETKVGNAVSLAIIFQSVARRLGVYCDLVCFPTHFFLCWKPKHDTENPEDEEYFYIDVLHGGFIRSRNDCPITRGRRCPIESFNEHKGVSPIEMVSQMISFLQTVNPNYQHHEDRALQIRSLVELRFMIEPCNIDVIESLGQHYLQYQINIIGLKIAIEKILNSNYCDGVSVEARRVEMTAKKTLTSYEMHLQCHVRQMSRNTFQPRKRSKIIKYAVGMLVYCMDRRIANETCVIIWWDEEYNSEVKIAQEHGLVFESSQDLSCTPDETHSVKQPFYTILCENGCKYYVSQDTLVKAYTPNWVEHNEIGRYFCRFAQSHYEPNNILTRFFPYDIDILNTLCLDIANTSSS